ncbi:MAG: rubredoxin [Fusobacteriaceae bacterium]|nr:rubredoxin [Fusobacteriaceae bacterium]
MDKYECKLCGYIYDPAQGDPDNGVPAGTAFEKLPASWVCPLCGAEIAEFEKVN